jgi:hypothetical protein
MLSGRVSTVASRTPTWSLLMASDYEFLPEGVRVFKGHFDLLMREEGIVSLPVSACSQSQAHGHLYDDILPFIVTNPP